MPSLIILTPAADNPQFKANWPIWFDRLSAPLAAAGVEARPHPWTQPLDPAGADAVLSLLSWGYHLAPQAWGRSLDGLEASGVKVINPLPVLRWNTAKTYLLEMAAAGVSVVPTIAVDKVTPEAVDAARARFGVETVVAKPQVSGGSHGTLKLSPGDGLAGGPTGPALLQPFLASVGDEGELSLFYFGGDFSHAVVKVAKAGDFRVQPQFGAGIKALTPPAEALGVARAVLDAAPGPLTYARVDLLRGLDGTLQLMELEVIEPDLYLQYAPDGGALFAAAVAATMRG
jgi:glutathione synthase/RimK-type ligase-like ATP-grasp enzyme